MPISGLSERRRFSRGGKIRLGKKEVSKKSGKEYPAKSDHFIFDPIDEGLLAKFAALFGDKPRRIKIAFASEDLESVFPQYYKCYSASGLLCKGDGNVAHRRESKDSPAIVECECPTPSCCDYAISHGVGGKPGCKQLASLQFFLPDLPVMQVFQIDTSSFNSIVNMNSQIDVLRRVCGRISFIPVDLVLTPKLTVNPENGKQVTIYMLDMPVGCGLRDVGGLRPLIAGPAAAGLLEAPPPSEDLPEDLYPRSQIQRPDTDVPARVESVTEDGEIIEVVPFEDDTDTMPPSLADDPDVQAALSPFPAAKQRALLMSAEQDGWSKETLLGAIAAQGTRGQPQQAPRQAPKPQPPAPAASDDDGVLF